MNRRGILKLLLSSPVLWLRPGTATAEGPSAGHLFGSDAGMILNTIKPDHAADFEAVLRRLKAALQASAEPVRKKQAEGWKVFKAIEPAANNNVLYIFWINPAVKGADYTVSKILYEAFPSEVNDLYTKFSSAYAGGQTMVNLQLLSNMAATE
jgi:copper oxidase (laccase) domain-containing protein